MTKAFGAHRRCNWCKKLELQKKMLDYNDNFYCCLACKIKQEESDDDSLYRMLRPVLGKHGGGK